MFNDETFHDFQAHKLPDAEAARAELEGLTPEQLDALEVYTPFGMDVYLVPESGEVVLPNGRKLVGMTPGNHLNIPKQQDAIYAMSIGADTPRLWRDSWGSAWRPVLTSNGWRKTPMRL